MQLAAKHADIWESSYLSPEQFAYINSKFEQISNIEKKKRKEGHLSNQLN